MRVRSGVGCSVVVSVWMLGCCRVVVAAVWVDIGVVN